ncbi:hypothetical protein B0O80DRAFT_489465 [Mortierella sp. GBAus27b]|nr:hypothetical protein BGX31_002886 [Mortierella sp. GBA43]KAI8349582.1 hypothetical protein B0O80DRAFT_489465 [Mortierella sp. GBAus27b]
MTAHPPPKVLIVGAGLGALFLAIVLEKANIPYHIYERAATVKPLGALLVLNASIAPAFDQLGLLEDLRKISYPMTEVEIRNENLELMGSIDYTSSETDAGYPAFVFHRPDLYNVLLSRVPVEKISFNKPIAGILQDEHGVTIHTTDGETFQGDILVGADGVRSTVRQQLYKTMVEQKEKIPESDANEKLKVEYISAVGTTQVLDPERFPILKDKRGHYSVVVGNSSNQNVWVYCTLPNNRISFMVFEQLKDASSKNTDALQKMRLDPTWRENFINQISPFTCLKGNPDNDNGQSMITIGDILQETPKNQLSLVLIEEKLFKTWYHGRTVLIGDAAHKMHPSSGQGCVNAMQDAIVLGNVLYEISDGTKPVTEDMITEAFKEYRKQRFPYAKQHVLEANIFAKIVVGKKWGETLLRRILVSLPKMVLSYMLLKAARYRPLVAFMPPVPEAPRVKTIPQVPSKRYMAQQATKA